MARSTATSVFGVSRRESHDASKFYERFNPPTLSMDDTVLTFDFEDVGIADGCILGDARNMYQVPDCSVALIVTSPPYFVGKEYELDIANDAVPTSYLEYLDLLREVFRECVRVLEPGGRIAVNVANLGRKPWRSLTADVSRILQDDLGLLLRGEVVWQKADGATGSVAWGSFRQPTNPVLRDISERVLIASKGRFDRAHSAVKRAEQGLPHESTITTDEFMEATLDIWRIDAEHASRVGHPAPFPVELPRRLIDLYTYRDDVVLDPFMGSGTTLVAALRSGRRGLGYDLDPQFVALASERVAAENKRIAEGLTSSWRRRDLTGSGKQETLFASGAQQEAVLDRAAAVGKKAADIAESVLFEAGFEVVKRNVVLRGSRVSYPFLVTDKAKGISWYVDVAGAFTTSRAGMRRSDVLWRTLGRAHILTINEPDSRLLILTAYLPVSGSDGDRALRSIGGNGLFDVIEMFDEADLLRLGLYAKEAPKQPKEGFWSEQELERYF